MTEDHAQALLEDIVGHSAELVALRDAAHLMLDELGSYERNWRSSSTGWTPINTAKHALRQALANTAEAEAAIVRRIEQQAIADYLASPEAAKALMDALDSGYVSEVTGGPWESGEVMLVGQHLIQALTLQE